MYQNKTKFSTLVNKISRLTARVYLHINSN